MNRRKLTPSAVTRKVRRYWLAGLGLLIFVAAVALAILAPWIAPYDPVDLNASLRLAPPGTAGHLLGLDEIGRDILSRLVWGARLTLVAAVIPLAVAITVGVSLGLISGVSGGRVDEVIMRIVDVLLAFPAILLAIAVVAMLGPGLLNAMLATTLVAIPNFARLTRGTVLSARENLYVTAAESMGAPMGRLMFKHILPNIASPLIVFSTLELARLIIFAASLGFLGLGVAPPTAEWGTMLADARQYIHIAPHVALLPGLAILAVTLGLNLAGDGLRDYLDPRLRGR